MQHDVKNSHNMSMEKGKKEKEEIKPQAILLAYAIKGQHRTFLS